MTDERNYTIFAENSGLPDMRVGTVAVFLGAADQAHNGTREHPALVTRVWGPGPTPTVNLKVLPDCGEPFDATSVPHWKTCGWPVGGKFEHCYREV